MMKHMFMRSTLFFLAAIMASCEVPQGSSADQYEEQSTFGVIESGQAAEFIQNQLAKNYYVVFDGSSSMLDEACGSQGKAKTDVAKTAVKKFAGMVPKDAYLGLLVFDSRGITERVPLGLDNRKAFTDAIDNAYADSGTPLATAIKTGYEALSRQAARQRRYGEYHLVIVTDGEANFGEGPGDIVHKILAESPVVIHTVGFCIGENHSLNQPDRMYYSEANSPEALETGLKDVLAEESVEAVDMIQD